jgi:hypothetical protein
VAGLPEVVLSHENLKKIKSNSTTPSKQGKKTNNSNNFN